jgi:hypothetical protein
MCEWAISLDADRRGKALFHRARSSKLMVNTRRRFTGWTLMRALFFAVAAAFGSAGVCVPTNGRR